MEPRSSLQRHLNFEFQRTTPVYNEFLKSASNAYALDHPAKIWKSRHLQKPYGFLFTSISQCGSSDHFSFRSSKIDLRSRKPTKLTRKDVPLRQGDLPLEVPAQIHHAQCGEESVHEEGEFRSDFSIRTFTVPNLRILTWSLTCSSITYSPIRLVIHLINRLVHACSTSPSTSPSTPDPPRQRKLIVGRYANWRPKRDHPKFRLQTRYLPVGFNMGETPFHKKFPIENYYKDIKWVCRPMLCLL